MVQTSKPIVKCKEHFWDSYSKAEIRHRTSIDDALGIFILFDSTIGQDIFIIKIGNGIYNEQIHDHSLLRATNLTNATLSGLPLPDTLNTQQATRLPSRITTLSVLFRDSLASLIRLPAFLPPLIVHIPAYAVARVGARLVEDEEETQAQNKIVFALLLLLAIYPAVFFFLWALFFMTPTGGIIALATSYAFVHYHTNIVDSNYEQYVSFSFNSSSIHHPVAPNASSQPGASSSVSGSPRSGNSPSQP